MAETCLERYAPFSLLVIPHDILVVMTPVVHSNTVYRTIAEFVSSD